MRNRFLGVRAIALLFLCTAAKAEPPLYQSELIFPMESWHNHSSSIVEQPNGDFLVCWFHGSGERQADDVKIEAARLSSKTGKWTERFTIADTPGFPDTNATMFIDRKQRLFLLWPVILANEWHTALMKYRISSDFQQPSGPPNWNFADNILLIPHNMEKRTREVLGTDPKAAELIKLAGDKYFSRVGWFTRTHPVQLASGRILVPMYSDGYSFSIMAISDDEGVTWHASEPIVGYGNIQPSVVRRKDGALVAYMRDNGPPPKRAMSSISTDDGETWTPATDTELLNPGTSVECIVLKDGSWLVVYNDLESGRYSLVAALSQDEGRTWPIRRHLDWDAAPNKDNQYHYPSVIQARDGSIHVTYSYFKSKMKSIKHVRMNEDWIQAGDPAK